MIGGMEDNVLRTYKEEIEPEYQAKSSECCSDASARCETWSLTVSMKAVTGHTKECAKVDQY